MKLLIITQKVDINDDILGFMHGWIAQLAKYCEKVTVICLQKGQHELPENVEVLSLGKEKSPIANRQSPIAKKLKYLFNFYKYILRKRKKYDTVFVHMNPEYVVLGGLLWRLWDKKISLWYAHGHVGLILKLAEKITHLIFSSSPEGCRLISQKIRIVGQGIDVEKFKSTDKKTDKVFKIITFGRISPSKDHETLIKAIEILQPAINLEVKVAGKIGLPEDAAYLENINNLIEEKKLGDIIKYIGSIAHKDIIDFIQSANLYVNMSHTGSLDKAGLEAMACGLPILTCNEAYGDVLAEYKTELMFVKKDTQGLAEKIKFIAAMTLQQRQALGEKLRQIVITNHSLENLVAKIINILETHGSK